MSIPEGYTTILLVTDGEPIIGDKYLQNGDMVHLSKSGTDFHLQSL